MAVRPGRKPGLWVIEFEQGGQRVHQRCPAGVTKAQAVELEIRLKRGLFDRDKLGKRPDITIQKAIELWLANNHRKNQKQALSEAKQWGPWVHLPLCSAPEVATAAIAAWSLPTIPTGKKRPVLPRSSTVNRRLALMKAVTKWAWQQELLGENLSGRIVLLPERNARETYLTKAQVKTLASCAPTDTCGAAILIAAYTGLRASELLALGRVSTRQVSLRVLQSKTGKPRDVPIAEPIRAALRVMPLSLTYWQLHDEFVAARKKAKMPNVQFHDLRHTCASWLINAGVDLYTVGRILGHSSTQTTARYAHLSDASLKAAMGKLK